MKPPKQPDKRILLFLLQLLQPIRLRTLRKLGQLVQATGTGSL